MKRFILLIIVAGLTITVLLLLFNPEVLEKIWLWLVGLAGVIVASVKSALEWVKKLLTEEESQVTNLDKGDNPSSSRPIDATQKSNELHTRISAIESELTRGTTHNHFKGHTLNLVRYTDDGTATLGLLFYNQAFFCYTLEDTHNEVKVPGKTRIPAGTYPIKINPDTTPLTEAYRNKYPWFTHHLELVGVPNFSKVYIHVGNYHHDTDGCILIADGIAAGTPETMVTHSLQAYQRLYMQLTAVLQQGTDVRIAVRNESWITEAMKHDQTTLTPAI